MVKVEIYDIGDGEEYTALTWEESIQGKKYGMMQRIRTSHTLSFKTNLCEECREKAEKWASEHNESGMREDTQEIFRPRWKGVYGLRRIRGR